MNNEQSYHLDTHLPTLLKIKTVCYYLDLYWNMVKLLCFWYPNDISSINHAVEKYLNCWLFEMSEGEEAVDKFSDLLMRL